MEQAILPTSRLSPVRYSASRAPLGAGPTVALLSFHCRLESAPVSRHCRFIGAWQAHYAYFRPAIAGYRHYELSTVASV
ncbi:hypothetical protein [Sphingobium yanoikuyae]|uniref:hypothetical protein n=1 Tax=Sphingobium yanoikuyae TaxID=13690 RepID=UPI002430B205|nr:hypothetical protein [Sphingobium yanoikuyae]